MLKIGDWVTQYYKGFWQIVDIKPKYAEEDYTFENGKSEKKGDLIGSWVLMKKGFTPKMKFRIDSGYCDGAWCKRIDATVQAAIDQYFAEHPDDYSKFISAPFVEAPAVSTTWVHLSPEDENLFRQVIKTLPPYFTADKAMECFKKNGLEKCFTKPPANYLFVCQHSLWDLDDKFDPLYKNPELQIFK